MNDLKILFPRVAIVVDQMTALGGADIELFSVLKILPHADIYTILFKKDKYPPIKQKIYTSFVQRKFKYISPRHLKIFNPLAYESFNLDGYDLVISISAGPARGVITGIYQPHVALVMTPPRSLWDNELNIRGSKLKWIYKPISKILNTYLRMWDWSISRRVDYWVANSKYIQKKIKRTYKEDSTLIYPGIRNIDIKKENLSKKYDISKKYFLVVSRLYDYKRVDWAIEACIKANKKLLIVGEGPDEKYLRNIAKGNRNIEFFGFLNYTDILSLYKNAQALLFCGIEDFGLVPVEAMACGTPVLGYKEGGLLETVLEGKTGEFFNTKEELIHLLKNFDKTIYNEKDIIKQSKKFTEDRFLSNLKKYLINVYKEEKSKGSRR
ncbi:MAG: glycosyltransferase [Candidatus Dojkabacteria bacterium]|nr:glycosyltransferase [Candidatus Dojkabacteria bacterium]